jgi:polyhydroxyalkanoate synthesis regulator phasin
MENLKTPLDKFTEFIGTVLTATEDRFQKILDEFIVTQDFGKKEAEDFSKKMKGIYDSNKTKLLSLIDESVKKALSKADIARGSEIKDLEEKIKTLEEKVNKQAHNEHTAHHTHAHHTKQQ